MYHQENNIAIYGSHNGGIAFRDHNTYRVIEIERFISKKNCGLTQYLLCRNSFYILEKLLDYINKEFNKNLMFDNLIYSNTDVIYGNDHVKFEDLISAKNKHFCLHHRAHAAGTFYQSPFNEAIIISYDGGGSDGFFNIFYGNRENSVTNIKNVNIDLGFAYMSFGHFINEIKFESELSIGNLVYSGKLMGLCGYGKVRKGWKKYFKNYYLSKPDGLNYIEKLNNFIGSKIGVVFNIDNRLVGDIALDIAATSQQVFEEIFLEIITPILESNEYKHLPICLTGGCALNVVCNTRVKDIFKRPLFVAPNSNDSGLALGMLLDYERPGYQVDVTYGGLPVLDPYSLYELIENKWSEVYSHEKMAEILNNGNIVGLIQGDCEHGPRALGNRSILCNPAIPNMKDTLNQKVKRREWFRPFAPVVKLEDANKYFEFDGESRFMSYYAKVREEYKEQLVSITHIDGTARLQTVTKDQNSFIYDLLTEFEKLSGIGVLLNTSFNINGKPLINSYKDGLWMLDNTGLDILSTDQFIVYKQ
jgi:carbamoyltransferase